MGEVILSHDLSFSPSPSGVIIIFVVEEWSAGDFAVEEEEADGDSECQEVIRDRWFEEGD